MTEFTTWRSLVDGEEISAIPDSDIFQDPIYRWVAGEGIGSNDGEEASTWQDKLASITASSTGSPTYRENQDGIEAVEYDDDTDDGHDWSGDADLPTGDDEFSIIVLMYKDDYSDQQQAVIWGEGNDGEAVSIRARSDNVELQSFGVDSASWTDVPTGEWITAMGTHDGSTGRIFGNGDTSEKDAMSPSYDLQDNNHAIGYNRVSDDGYFNGFIADVIISGTEESASDFETYHDEWMDIIT